jgi:hypothetical protein
VVGANGKIHLQPVVIGRELGADIELASGVKADDQLIINPSDSLNDGDVVSVVAPKDKDNKPSDKANKGAAS